MEDVVDAGTEEIESPSVNEGAAESESTSVDREREADAEGERTRATAESKIVESEKLQKFLKSRGRDAFDVSAQDEIADLIHKGLGYGKRNAELESKLAEIERSRPAEPVVPPEPPPELKELDAHITALKARETALAERETQGLRDYAHLTDAIARAEVRLEVADELDKPRREMELQQAKHDRAQLVRYLQGIPDDRERLQVELKRTERERKATERDHVEGERARQEAESSRASFMAEFPTTVDNLITRFADELKIPGDQDLRKEMNDAVCDSLTVAFWRLKEAGQQTADVAALVRAHVERFGKRHGLIDKLKLSQVSRDKRAVAPSVAVSRTKAPIQGGQRLSEEEVLAKERADRVARLQRALG